MLDVDTVHPQIIEFNEDIHVFQDARIDFKSLMAAVGDGQFASLDVSDDDGATWTSLWKQFGAGGNGAETQFSSKTASLAACRGKTIRVRFVFDVDGNAILLPQPGDPSFNSIGWYLDDIAFTNAAGLLTTTQSPVFTQPKFTFKPEATGNYLLEFQAIIGARTYPYGPVQQVNVQANPPTVSISKNIVATANRFTMEFTATATASFSVESATSIIGPWSPDPTAVITGPVQGVFAVTIPRNGDVRFYQVIAN